MNRSKLSYGMVVASLAFLQFSRADDDKPSINTPMSLVQCLPVVLNVGGGSPPYFVSIIPGGEPAAASVETFPTLNEAGPINWMVDQAPGTKLTFQVRDSKGAINYSQATTVTAGGDCSQMSPLGIIPSAGSQAGGLGTPNATTTTSPKPPGAAPAVPSIPAVATPPLSTTATPPASPAAPLPIPSTPPPASTSSTPPASPSTPPASTSSPSNSTAAGPKPYTPPNSGPKNTTAASANTSAPATPKTDNRPKNATSPSAQGGAKNNDASRRMLGGGSGEGYGLSISLGLMVMMSLWSLL